MKEVKFPPIFLIWVAEPCSKEVGSVVKNASSGSTAT